MMALTIKICSRCANQMVWDDQSGDRSGSVGCQLRPRKRKRRGSIGGVEETAVAVEGGKGGEVGGC